MPPVRNSGPADSRRDLRYEVIFLVRGRREETLPHGKYLVNITVEHPAEGSWSGSMELFDAEGDYLEILALNLGADTQVTFRFWEDGKVSPYFTGGITSLEPEFRPEGIGLKIGLVSKVVHDTVLSLKPRGFVANTNPSEVVRKIADDRGWKYTDDYGKSTIEDAHSPLDHAVQTTNESDVAFIMGRVMKHAVNAFGQHFTFRLSGHQPPIVYFHAVMASLVQSNRRTYTYLRDPNGEVIRFAPKDNIIGGWLMGGGNARLDAVDSANGASTTIDATGQGGVKGVVALGDASHTTAPKDGTVARRLHAAGRSVVDTLSAAQHLWSKASEQALKAELEVIGTHDVSPCEFIDVNYYRRDGTAHPFGGTYRVLKVTHDFGMSGWNTVFDLARNGRQQSPGTVKMDVKSQITPPSKPPADVVASSVVRTGGTKTRSDP